MKAFIQVSLLMTICFNCFAQTERKIDWKSDLDCLKKELPQKHINLFFAMTKSAFNTGIDELIEQLPILNDFEIADRLLQHLAKIKDSHIHVDFGKLNNPDKMLPFSLDCFSDGLYITYTKQGYEHLLGKKLVKINDYRIEQIVDSLSTLIAVDNQSTIKNTIPMMICFYPHLDFFGFTKKELIKLTIEETNGINSIVNLSDTALLQKKWIVFKQDSAAFCWKNRSKYFVEQYFEKDSIYYLQYNKCWSKEYPPKYGDTKKNKDLPSFEKFEKDVFQTIKDKPIKKLIIDMRFNGGGTSDQGTDFIKRLARCKEVNQKGKLFVVTGKQTYSSGLVNVMDFKNLTQAIFVGEETSGKPNHYGETSNLVLKSSGLIISYSTRYFKYSDIEIDSFRPDITIETSFSEYKQGVDPVFEYIKKYK